MTDRQVFIYTLAAVIVIMVIQYSNVIYHYLIREIAECGKACVFIEDGRIEVGYIGWRGGRAFKKLIQEQSASDVQRVVRMNSVGGDFGVAMAMTEALRAEDAARPVRIEVLAGGRCESMCTVLWTAASQRVAAPDARFMFHAPRHEYSAPEERFVDVGPEALAMRAAIGRVDPALLAEIQRRGAFAAVPENVTLTAAEIAALGGDYLRLDSALR